MKNSTTAFDKFLSPYKTKENLAKENRNTKTYELSFVTELCNTYSNDEHSGGLKTSFRPAGFSSLRGRLRWYCSKYISGGRSNLY